MKTRCMMVFVVGLCAALAAKTATSEEPVEFLVADHLAADQWELPDDVSIDWNGDGILNVSYDGVPLPRVWYHDDEGRIEFFAVQASSEPGPIEVMGTIDILPSGGTSLLYDIFYEGGGNVSGEQLTIGVIREKRRCECEYLGSMGCIASDCPANNKCDDQIHDCEWKTQSFEIVP